MPGPFHGRNTAFSSLYTKFFQRNGRGVPVLTAAPGPACTCAVPTGCRPASASVGNCLTSHMLPSSPPYFGRRWHNIVTMFCNTYEILITSAQRRSWIPSQARAPHAATSLPEIDYLSSGAAAVVRKTLNHVTSHLAAFVKQDDMSCLWNIQLEIYREGV